VSVYWFFAFFLVSGFCSLVYQLVWLRVAMAEFGVTTAMASIVLSVFMAGLAIGSWTAGALATRWHDRPAESVIALGAFVAVRVFSYGHLRMAAGQAGLEWGSGTYHAAAGLWVALGMLPFCICMGATMPLGMWAIRRLVPAATGTSFSFLYVANVLGAILGTTMTAFFLIEVLGFRDTLALAAALNLALAATAAALAATRGTAPAVAAPAGARPAATTDGRFPLWALFVTGLASMAMEVVWVRQFTAYLGNVVYAFAVILDVYLLATLVGSRTYRLRTGGIHQPPEGTLWALVAAASLLPLAAADPRLGNERSFLWGALRLAIGIGPLCAMLGFVTPLLVDRWSGGDPRRAGHAYGVNVLGCIIGPLVAGFVLIPWFGERWALAILALLVCGLGLATLPTPRVSRGRFVAAVAVGVFLLAVTRDFETIFPRSLVRRDETATVVATGEGMERRLRVNGLGMTRLTPITKFMAHLPLAFLATPPESGLTICFGMGTTFRSVLSWGARSTVVELVPSVPKMFPYFHANADIVANDPRARIVIDDGRRFLERTNDQFDVVMVDPPPPIQAAGSSLLYTVEFYEAVARRLRPGGILQAWVPAADPLTLSALVSALRTTFPYVRAFGSIEGWGVHLLATAVPLPTRTAAELAERLPAAARADLLEWGPEATVEAQFAQVLAREIDPMTFIAAAPAATPLRDDHPINEYYLLRAARLASTEP
jgi:spermidine synthase